MVDLPGWVRYGYLMRILVCSLLSLLASPSFAAAAPGGLLPGSAKPVAPDQRLSTAEEKRSEGLAHFLEGLRLESNGQMREALGHYLKALQGGGSAVLTERVAAIASSYGSVDEALKLFEDAAKSPTASAELLAAYTRFCATHSVDRKDLLHTAEKISEEALARFPQDVGAYQSAVRFYLSRGDRTKAGQALEQALKQSVPNPQFWLDTGHMAQEVWPLADSEKRAEHLAKINPFFEQAEKTAQQSNNESAALSAADYYLFSNQLDRSASICEMVVKHHGSLAAHKRLLRLYDAMGRSADSLKALETLVNAFPQDVEHRRLLAGRYLEKRDLPGALTQLEAALQAGGGGLPDYLQICNLLRYSRQPEKYLQFTRRSAQLYPGECRTLFQEALALNQNKSYPESIKLFEKSAKLAETQAPELLNDDFRFSFGISLERSGRFDEAATQFEKSIELTPKDDPPRAANAMNYLGYMWLERGEHLDRAEELIKKATEFEPENAAYLDSLGWVHFKTGKVEQALNELLDAEKKLKQVDPDDAEILDHIAQAYDRMGQRAKAEEYWKRVLDLKPPDEKLTRRVEKELGTSKPQPPKDDPALKTR